MIRGEGKVCSYYDTVIPQLSPVEVTDGPTISIKDNCNILVEFKGTKGMELLVTYKYQNEENKVQGIDVGNGKYEVELPRFFNPVEFTFVFSREGMGSVEKKIKLKDDFLLATPFRIVTSNGKLNSDLKHAETELEIENFLEEDITLDITRYANTKDVCVARIPWIKYEGLVMNTEDPNRRCTITIPAKQTIQVSLFRDYSVKFDAGSYDISFYYLTCNDYYGQGATVRNQRDLSYGFGMIDGEGGQGGGPSFDPVTQKYHIQFTLDDGLPNTSVQLYLSKGGGLHNPYTDGVTGPDGCIKLDFYLTKEEYDKALGKDGFINFNNPSGEVLYKKDVTFEFK